MLHNIRSAKAFEQPALHTVIYIIIARARTLTRFPSQPPKSARDAARYPVVVTLDADLENPPELVPAMLRVFEERGADLLVASRTFIPRVSERLATATVGRIVGVMDVFSNFRVYRRDRFAGYRLRLVRRSGASCSPMLG